MFTFWCLDVGEECRSYFTLPLPVLANMFISKPTKLQKTCTHLGIGMNVEAEEADEQGEM